MELSEHIACFYVDRAPPSIKQRLTESEDAITACGGNHWKLLGYEGFGTFNQTELLDRVRDIFEDGEEKEITSEDGVIASIQLGESGLTLRRKDQVEGGRVVTPKDLYFLHPDKEVRKATFDEMHEQYGVTGPSRAEWATKIETSPLSNAEIVQVFREIRTSVPSVSERMHQAFLTGEAPEEIIIPRDMLYFEKLCGPLPEEDTQPDSYFSGPLRRHREAMLRENLVGGIDLCCLGFLREDLHLSERLNDIEPRLLMEIINGFRPFADPYTALACFDIAIRRSNDDAEFLELAGECIERLCEKEFLSTSQNDVYELLPHVVSMLENRLSIMPIICVQPPYWRKLAAWMHAGVIIRCMDELEFDKQELIAWLKAQEVFEGTAKRIMDLRVEPRAPELVGGSFSLRAEMIGRLRGLTSGDGYSDRKGKIYQEFQQTVLEGLKEVKITAFLPGPLEGHLKLDALDPGRALTPELREDLEKLYDADLSQARWGMPRNTALFFWVNDDIATGLKKSFSHAKITSGDTRERELNSIANFAHFGAIRRDVEIANLVAEKCIGEAPEVKNAVEGRVLAVVILIAAAAHEKKSDYSEWLSRQLRVLFERLPPGEACCFAYEFTRAVRTLDDLKLGVLSQAEAIALLGCGK